MGLAGDEDDVRAVGLVGMRHVAPVALTITGAVEALRNSVATSLFSLLDCVLLAGDEVEVVAVAALTGH